MTPSAHLDRFAAENLPPPETWPRFLFARPEFRFPPRLNAAALLLDRQCAAGFADRLAVLGPRAGWTYGELKARAERIARVLVEDFHLVPGNRVLLRGANTPALVACWFAVLKAGGIAVTTMPLLRAKELATILDKARVDLALSDASLMGELESAVALAATSPRLLAFDSAGAAELEERLALKPEGFQNCDTAAEDTAIIAFTSGTTGKPKGTMHFHRDLIAIAEAFPRQVLRPRPEDVFTGSPPLAFTFGLGGLLVFPLYFGAAALLLEQGSPPHLLEAVERFGVTTCFTAPTGYRALLGLLEARGQSDLASLRTCVSAGETLPLSTFEAFAERTGLKIIDGIGSTEMLHIFISAPPERIRPGSTGQTLAGYEAKVVGEDFQELPAGEEGRLAVRGPTGCRYLADERQKDYVQQGWNVTGDTYRRDEEGYFRFVARSDDMIISSGYNISGPEVEDALLAHPAVAECGVVAAPDEDRGSLVKAYVVLREGHRPSDALKKDLQDFVKASIAPYKYPRALEFLDRLPKTETGKLKRFELRRRAAEGLRDG